MVFTTVYHLRSIFSRKIYFGADALRDYYVPFEYSVFNLP